MGEAGSLDKANHQSNISHLVLHPLARAQQDEVLLAQTRQVRWPCHRAGPRRRLRGRQGHGRGRLLWSLGVGGSISCRIEFTKITDHRSTDPCVVDPLPPLTHRDGDGRAGVVERHEARGRAGRGGRRGARIADPQRATAAFRGGRQLPAAPREPGRRHVAAAPASPAGDAGRAHEAIAR